MKTSIRTTSPIRFSTRGLLRARAAMAAPLLAAIAMANPVAAAPNKTRPTVLNNVAVVTVGTSQMRATGTLTIAGMRVDIYAVGVASFTRWSTVYTGNNGSFAATVSKPPAGMKIQIEVEGNGAYSRPLPTFNRS